MTKKEVRDCFYSVIIYAKDNENKTHEFKFIECCRSDIALNKHIINSMQNVIADDYIISSLNVVNATIDDIIEFCYLDIVENDEAIKQLFLSMIK